MWIDKSHTPFVRGRLWKSRDILRSLYLSILGKVLIFMDCTRFHGIPMHNYRFMSVKFEFNFKTDKIQKNFFTADFQFWNVNVLCPLFVPKLYCVMAQKFLGVPSNNLSPCLTLKRSILNSCKIMFTFQNLKINCIYKCN
jgi:hypothetical protein